MNTEPKAIEVEVVAPDDNKLVKYAAETGLEKPATAILVEAFRPIFAKSREALADARGVAESVKDATCVREIMRSRACRLALRAVRLESDETRKKHKQHALLYGRAVDGFHNILLADLSPVETALKEAEDTAERAEAKRLAELRAAREAELVPLLDEPLLGNLADLSEADYRKKLSNAKLLRQAKLDAAAKVEAERKAKEEAAFVAAATAEAENAKLKAEAIAREAAAKAEREAAEKKLAEERSAAAAAAKAAAEKAAQQRAALEAAARIEKEKALAAAKAESDRLAEIARQERTAETARQNEAARKAQVEAQRLRDELAARAKAEAAAAARVEAERKAAAAAEKRAAAEPDKAKLAAFASVLRRLPVPSLNDKPTDTALRVRIAEFCHWCENESERV